VLADRRLLEGCLTDNRPTGWLTKNIACSTSQKHQWTISQKPYCRNICLTVY